MRMLYTYFSKLGKFVETDKVEPEALWYDLFKPKPHERLLVEKALNISIPTHEEMEEIEASSRLYKVQDTLFMTAVILSHADTENPKLSPVTFIFANKHLITIRYDDNRPFHTFSKNIEKQFHEYDSVDSIFLGLIETIVYRVADILEKIGSEIDGISEDIFKKKTLSTKTQKGWDKILTQIGKKRELTTKTKESLVTLGRLLIFFNHHMFEIKEKKKYMVRIKTLQRDVDSIAEHVSFILNKIYFLLDTTLGYINIEQNNIIKIFSIAAVIFLPPTLIASIYGMNFIQIPELKWPLGYPFAVLLMVLSALAPFVYFKRKHWL